MEGEGSNPVANFLLSQEIEKREREAQRNLETKQKNARPPTTSDAQARSKSKTQSLAQRGNKRLDSKDVNED